MKEDILNEQVAIVAKRSEWAGLLCELATTQRYGKRLTDNPDTMGAASSNADNPDSLLDIIAITNVDTQLRVERNIHQLADSIKVMRAHIKPAWEPSDEVTHTD